MISTGFWSYSSILIKHKGILFVIIPTPIVHPAENPHDSIDPLSSPMNLQGLVFRV